MAWYRTEICIWVGGEFPLHYDDENAIYIHLLNYSDMQWWRERIPSKKWLIINGEVAYMKLVGLSKISEQLGKFWWKVRCKLVQKMRSREGDGITDVNSAKHSNLIKYFWVMGIVEYLQLAVH
jgi:hypothetical protein